MAAPAPTGIPADAVALFAELLARPARTTAELRAELRAHLATIEAAARDNELLDEALAQKLARVCEALLHEAEARGPEVHALVQAAVTYFILDDDADPDLHSVCGLDDDAEVCNAVARHLGRDDLVIAI